MQERKELSAFTRLAVDTFKKLVKTETKMILLKWELDSWVARIPDEDVDEYVEITEKIRKEETQRLETLIRRAEKRMPR